MELEESFYGKVKEKLFHAWSIGMKYAFQRLKEDWE